MIITPLSADRPAEQTTRACVLLTGRTTFDGSMMNQSEFRNYHEREARRLRSLLAIETTPALKARLLEEAEKHEQLVEEELEDLNEAPAA